jgi:hypothetical protein
MSIRSTERLPAWASVVIGLCVFALRYASPRPSFDVHRNLFFTGLLIMFVAFAAVIANEGDASWNYWSGINVAVGAWLIASATLIPAISAVAIAQTILGAVLALVALVALAIETTYHWRHARRIKRSH